MSKRMDELLLAAAGALEDGRDPLSIELLGEHSVTFTESEKFTEHLAQVLRGYVAAPRGVRLAVLLCSASEDIGLDPVFLSAIALKNEALREILGLDEQPAGQSLESSDAGGV